MNAVQRRLARYPEAVRMVEDGTAPELTRRAVELLRKGLRPIDMPPILGRARATVYQALSDPTGEKALVRKHKVHGTCRDCGRPTYNNGSQDVPERCRPCAETRNLDRNEQVIDLWERGWRAPEIAERLGMTERAVSALVNDLRLRRGIPVTLHRLRNREAWPTIERMWKTGATRAEIALAIDSTPASVSQMVATMREAGYDLPYRLDLANPRYPEQVAA